MKCEGACCECKNDAIGRFRITSSWFYGIEFNYCQECLDYDKGNGFEFEEVSHEETP